MVKRFVTIVTHIENLELRKDTGQIPYQFHKVLGYDSTLVSYFYTLKGGRAAGSVKVPPTGEEEINLNYPYLKTETPGLKLHFLEDKGRGKFYERAVYEYLKQNSKNIDILNLFHFNPQNIFYSLFYKLKNPRGRVYIKLDINIPYLKLSKEIFNIKGLGGKVKKQFYNLALLPAFFKVVRLISVESEEGMNYFSRRFPLSAKKLVLIPNGIDHTRIDELIPKKKGFEEKENIILTVGRIGTAQKNTGLLLDAIPRLAQYEWKFCFAGPIEKGFEETITAFYRNNPHLKKYVLFAGNITDLSVLYEWYNRSKIFCLPSRWEGFPLAAVEAACFSNILVLSDAIEATSALIKNGGGKTFKTDDAADLTNVIGEYLKDESEMRVAGEKAGKHAADTFRWEGIVKQIDKILYPNG